ITGKWAQACTMISLPAIRRNLNSSRSICMIAKGTWIRLLWTYASYCSVHMNMKGTGGETAGPFISDHFLIEKIIQEKMFENMIAIANSVTKYIVRLWRPSGGAVICQYKVPRNHRTAMNDGIYSMSFLFVNLPAVTV